MPADKIYLACDIHAQRHQHHKKRGETDLAGKHAALLIACVETVIGTRVIPLHVERNGSL